MRKSCSPELLHFVDCRQLQLWKLLVRKETILHAMSLEQLKHWSTSQWLLFVGGVYQHEFFRVWDKSVPKRIWPFVGQILSTPSSAAIFLIDLLGFLQLWGRWLWSLGVVKDMGCSLSACGWPCFLKQFDGSIPKLRLFLESSAYSNSLSEFFQPCEFQWSHLFLFPFL